MPKLLQKIPGYKIWAGYKLRQAAKAGDLAGVEKFLGLGANPNADDISDNTAIIFAAAGGHAAIIQKLAAAGGDVNRVTIYKDTAIMKAVAGGHAVAFEALLALGATVSGPATGWGGILDEAVSGGNLDIVKKLYILLQPTLETSQYLYRRTREGRDGALALFIENEIVRAENPWQVLSGGRIAHVTKLRGINREISRIFDFAAGECYEMSTNYALGSESTVIRKFNEVSCPALLAEARQRMGKETPPVTAVPVVTPAPAPVSTPAPKAE